MSVTAKQIAQQLGLSPAAVSLALNQRPGVSNKTRNLVMQTARTLGFDFSKVRAASVASGIIAFVTFNRSGIFGLPFFARMIEGVESELHKAGYRLAMVHVSASEDLGARLDSIRSAGYTGLLLLATEMSLEDLEPFMAIDVPMVLLDTCHEAGVDRVKINNRQGMQVAIQRLERSYGSLPGHLMARSTLSNFRERRDGYLSSVVRMGGTIGQSIRHELPLTVEQAKRDMLDIIDSGKALANCYVADYDDIAIGAMEAFSQRGYRIPEDIGFIGFDNSVGSAYVRPGLTSVNVPSSYMGAIAARRLLEVTTEDEHHATTIEIGVSLMVRGSC